MKIDFEDGSYIDFSHSSTPGKVIISIGAKNFKNVLETIINSVEISYDEFMKLKSDIELNKLEKVVES